MAKSETEIIREICDYLRSAGILFWRSNNFPVPGRAMPKDTPRGLPDINIVHRGRYVAFEVKRPGSDLDREANGRRVRRGMLSPYQAEWGARLVKAGGNYHCVRSLEEAMVILVDFYLHADEAR